MLTRSLQFSKLLNYWAVIQTRSFKSEYSLEKIYPNSSLDLSKPKEIKTCNEKFSGCVPIDKLQITYCRSSGPGGQHVNKVNTKVEVRFHLPSASWIPEETRKSLLKLHYSSITKEGFMILKSDKTRLQTLNLADCMDKLRCYIREAEKPPPEILPETLAIMKKRYLFNLNPVAGPLKSGFLHICFYCENYKSQWKENLFWGCFRPCLILKETKNMQERAAAERLREKRHNQTIRRMNREGLDNVQI